MERQPKQPNGGEQQPQPERPQANSYGTDDPEVQAHIENARIDAARERERDRARLERLVELGMTPDDAESIVEFDHYVRDSLRVQESGQPGPALAEVESSPAYRPRVHVIDIVSQQHGSPYGAWVDADQEADELQASIAAILDGSPTPEATGWAIDAAEGFAGLALHGFTDVELITTLARGVAEHGAAYAAWVGITGTDDRDLLDRFIDFYVGSYDSPEAWAHEVTEDMEWPRQLDNLLDPMLRRYVTIDYVRFARESSQSWDVIQGTDGRTHVFLR
jgi:antirestriction protein